MSTSHLPKSITKEVLFERAKERFQDWARMYADPSVSAAYMYEDMAASCYCGAPQDDFPEIKEQSKEDVYLYDDDHSNCFFYHRGVKFNVASLSSVQPRKTSGETTAFDICVVLCDHQDPKYSVDGMTWWHFLPEAWICSSGADLNEDTEVCSLFIDKCDEYIDAWGEERLIELQKQEK